MPLNKLPSETVSLLSSMQVIQNTSTAVKELMENSLDAAATNIEVKLDNFGFDRIEVKDDGKGISSEDVYLMCKRSYTSKLSCFEDLRKISTFGFRGEALYSLCTVGTVSVTTITEADKIATTYTYDHNGNVILTKPSHVIKGTTVVVEDLFRNLPVRKQVLSTGRKKSEELKKVELIIKTLGLIHPRLRVVFTHNKFVMWQKNSVPSLRLSFSQVVAPTIVKQLVDINFSSSEMTLHMLLPQKDCNVSSTCYGNIGDAVYLFVNRRPIKNKKIEKAVQEEISNYFGHEIPTGKYPTCLIAMTVPPKRVDVNLEPNKTQVMLMDEIEKIKVIRNQIVNYYIGHKDSPLDFESAETIASQGVLKRPLTEDPEEGSDGGSQLIKKRPQNKTDCFKLPFKENVSNDEIKKSTIVSNVSSDLLNSRDEDRNSLSEFVQKQPPSDISERNKNINNFLEGLSVNGDVLNKQTVGPNLSESLNENSEVSMTGSGSKELKSDVLNNTEEASSVDVSSITLSQWSRGQIKMNEVTVNSSTCVVGAMDIKVVVNNEAPTPIVNIDPLTKTPVKEEPVTELPAPVDVNSFTLSQWSRGQISIDGSRVSSSSTLMGSKELPVDVKRTNNENSLVNNMTITTNGEDTSERSVTSQMGRKDLVGFTQFASDMASKIATLGPNGKVSFGKVASELATKWRELQDTEKDEYKKKARSVKEIKESKDKASMREQLLKFLAKSNEKKVLKRRKYNSTLDSNASISSLRKSFERRISKAKETSELHMVGDIIEESKDELKIAVEGPDYKKLYVFSQPKLLESLFFAKNLGTMIVPFRILPFPIHVTEEDLGQSLWSILVSLETALDVKCGNWVISDNRLTSNGIRIEIVESPIGKCYQMTDVPLHISIFGVEDIKQILRLIELNPAVTLEDCRPSKISSYIRAESLRMLMQQEKMETHDRNWYLQKIKFWLDSVKDKRCLHYKLVYKEFNLGDIIK